MRLSMPPLRGHVQLVIEWFVAIRIAAESEEAQMASNLKSILLIAGIVLTLPAAARGQATTPSTRMVQLSVVALDAHGSPVTNLKSEDFQVSDGGKPQHVVFA